LIEWYQGPDINEARAVEKKVDDGSKNFLFRISGESAIPCNRTALSDAKNNFRGKDGNEPAANAASKSSLPIVLTIPVTNIASARYCATYDSRLMKPCFRELLIRYEKARPDECQY
jgi:hypothetical protein